MNDLEHAILSNKLDAALGERMYQNERLADYRTGRQSPDNLRDRVAMAALQNLGSRTPENIAKDCYAIADAFLAERGVDNGSN